MPKNGKTEREGITIFIFLFLLSLLLIARLMTLFIEEGVINTNYRDPRIETEYFRGTIYDRSGNILAMDRNDYFLSIDSERVNEVSRFSSTVSPYVDINPVVLENMIRKGEKLELRTNLLSSEIEAFLSLMRKENFDHLISLERIRERIYPSGVHGIEIIGREAESSSFSAESVYDSILEPPLSISDALSTGEDITLSMSQRMQYTADHIVASYKEENEYLEARENPIIVHLTGLKPAFKGCGNKFRDEWWEYAKHTSIYEELKNDYENSTEPDNHDSFLNWLFSIKNEYQGKTKTKVLRILGIKIKLYTKK